MKRYLPLLGALLLLLLAACASEETEPARPPEDEGPLQLEALSVEVSRGELSAEELAQAVRELPEALKAALAEQGVEAETVTVSAGSSPAAMAQAVSEGGVDVAFLPMEEFSALGNWPPLPRLLLTSEDEEGTRVMAVISNNGALEEEETFALALAAAVNGLREDQPVFGGYDYAWAGAVPG
ncbi:hypothetical protein [Oscillibacter sp.]|uniref:hypothetical protein n=1 Tax=Oscillibacter sp. TaxID=1945593 RepID=UPI002D80BA9E|nr:hypothetical protein [Oscillibacter sp.]